MGKVLIAGGGIGGLAVALAAARNGHEAVVLERRPEFSELGAGIQLAPNAFRALDHLGAGDEVRARAVFVEELRLMNAVSGDLVGALDLGPAFRSRYGQPYAVVHRGDLYEPLLRACRASSAITLRDGSAVISYEHNGSSVAATLASGEVVLGDALIGADGLRSSVRAQLVGDGAPRVSGHLIYRSVVPIEDMDPAMRTSSVTLWAGPGYHMVHYPIASGQSFNMAITVDTSASVEVVGEPVARDEVLRTFAHVHPEVHAMLERGRDWRTWVLCDRDPVAVWADGPVVLIGDAAHPTLQYAAQGAAMALEDAVCLDGLLGGRPDFAEVFRIFNEVRHERTGAVQIVSRWMGTEVYHAAGADAVSRDTMFAALDQDAMCAKVEWLYAHEASTTVPPMSTRSRPCTVPALPGAGSS